MKVLFNNVNTHIYTTNLELNSWFRFRLPNFVLLNLDQIKVSGHVVCFLGVKINPKLISKDLH